MIVWLWESQIELLIDMLKKRQAQFEKRGDWLEVNLAFEIIARLEGKVTGPEWTLDEEDSPEPRLAPRQKV